MTYEHTIVIDCSEHIRAGSWRNKFPPSMNARLHWSSRAKLNKIWRARTYVCVGKDRPESPLEKCHAVITRYGVGMVDFDNMVTSNKPIVDGLVDAGVMVDDSAEYFSAEYLFCKCKRGAERIEIKVRGE